MSDIGVAEIGSDQVLTREEGVALGERNAHAASTAQWHWMGNYGNVYDVVAVANSRGCGTGSLVTDFQTNGLMPTYMFY
ncbi:hypothetical protein GCM10007304_07800 [Rhodococcoides trifolii]|uniref:Uncharacterized protein n=1 Tax=Rhodococcoides trifolii TaxID=908250 RepID=A0A917CSB1_9NOCA|nr:hypothetical protein [Rhodococcus trifolii]GGF96281.1 hypothetical protein GCM10007304_07800 [Rhodococcus trifolii]